MQKIICGLYRARLPVVFWGPPGVGKTAAIEAFARTVGAELIVPTVRAPEDVAVPVVSDGHVRVVPVDEFARAASAECAIVFVDEISTLPPAVQAAVLRFLDSGLVGGTRIPSTVWRVAAANPPEMAAGGWDLAAPTANRLVHIQWRLEPLEWASEFVAYWGAPPRLAEVTEEAWRRARILVASFIRSRPDLLLRVPKDESGRGTAWPSPRTWDMASRAIATAPDDKDLLMVLVSGCVGEGAALEFLRWLEDLDLPDPEEILANPDALSLPERGDKAFAVLASVVAAAIERLNADRWMAAWKVLAKAAQRGQKDIAAAAARDLARARRNDLPLPVAEVREFVPLLKAAGMM